MKLYNTRTRHKENFLPIKGKTVRLYSCGPTVYHYAHIGNLRTYIFSDILKRALCYAGYNVRHVINITDVGHLTSDADIGDDKMLLASVREKKSAWDIAAYYTEVFKKNSADLNIIPPDVWCKATDHIKQQIALIVTLEQKGYTYRISDGVYYDTSKFKEYAKFAHLKLSDQKAGARVGENKEKRHPWDFALWKFSLLKGSGQTRDMEWDSPWGRGFPGWHIECSAMSAHYLGQPFDIHTGGIDLIPIHHTNEIAQSHAAYGKPLARWWMHAAFLIIDAGRMGKSQGNFITLQTLIDRGYNPIDYRFLCYSARYRHELTFSWPALDAAREGRARMNDAIAQLRKKAGAGRASAATKSLSSEYEKKFRAAIIDDINMPKALSILFSYLKHIHIMGKTFRAGDYSHVYQQILTWDAVFGLRLEHFSKKNITVPSDIDALVQERERARTDKNWKKADMLRKQIEQAGFHIEDTVAKTRLTRHF